MKKSQQEINYILRDGTLSHIDKIGKIKDFNKKRSNIYDKEYNIAYIKNIGGGIIMLVVGIVPLGGSYIISSKLGGTIIKILSPIIGKKLAEIVTKGIVEGLVSGSVFSLGENIANDNKFIYSFKNIVKNAIISTIFGLFFSYGLGKLNKLTDMINLLKVIDKKLKIRLSKLYYTNYERGLYVLHKKLGVINLPSDGFKETLTQNFKAYKEVINLARNISRAKYNGKVVLSNHPHKYPIEYFYYLESKNVNYLIAQSKNGKKYFYKVVDSAKRGPKPPGQNPPDTFFEENLVKMPNLSNSISNSVAYMREFYNNQLSRYKKLLLFLLLLHIINKKKKEKRNSLKNINSDFHKNNLNTKPKYYSFLNPNVLYESVYNLEKNYVKKYPDLSQNNSNNYLNPKYNFKSEAIAQVSKNLNNPQNKISSDNTQIISNLLNSFKKSKPIELSKFNLKDHYPQKTDFVELDMSEPKRTQSTDYSYYKQKEQSNIDIGQLLSNLINIFGSVE